MELGRVGTAWIVIDSRRSQSRQQLLVETLSARQGWNDLRPLTGGVAAAVHKYINSSCELEM